jgi:hypothetical protein
MASDQTVSRKATVTNGAITNQSVAGVKAVAGVAHTVSNPVSFWYRGQLITLRPGEPFIADAGLIAYCAANGIAITVN